MDPRRKETISWSEVSVSLRNLPVRLFYFGLATWVQLSHPASPRPSSVPGANLVLTHSFMSFLPDSTAILQFWCHDRLCEWSGLWIQMAVHRQRHRICRKLIAACLDFSSSPHFHDLGPPRPGGSQGRAICMYVCMVITHSRVCINRVRLPNLLVVS